MIGGCRGEKNAVSKQDLVEILDDGMCERKIRNTIKHLVIEHGIPIASGPHGYYTPMTADELTRACDYYRSYAMSCLAVESSLRRCSLPDILQQLKIDFDQKHLAAGGAESEEENQATNL